MKERESFGNLYINLPPLKVSNWFENKRQRDRAAGQMESSPNKKFWTIGDLHPMADLPAGFDCNILCANRDVVVVHFVYKKMIFFVPTSSPSSSSASFVATVRGVRVPSVSSKIVSPTYGSALSPSGRRLAIHFGIVGRPPVRFALIDAADAHFTRDVIVHEYVISGDTPLYQTCGVFFAGNDDAICSLQLLIMERWMRVVSLMPAKRAMHVQELATNPIVQRAYSEALQGRHILQQLHRSPLGPDNSRSIRVVSFNSLSSYTQRDFHHQHEWLGDLNMMGMLSDPPAHPDRVRFLSIRAHRPHYIANQQEDGALVFSKLVLPPGKYEEIDKMTVEQEPSDNLYFIVHFADKGAMLVRGRLRDSHSLASLARAAYYKSAAHREHGLLLDCGLQLAAAPRYRLQTK